MTGIVFALLALGYLVFLIDWKELRAVLAQGGWATVGIYIVVGVLIFNALTAPAAIAPAIHH